jgi:5-methylcytosine-specific restriction protein A
MKKVMCAGCGNYCVSECTSFYRNKRWCNNPSCKDVIDEKVKSFNYKKRQKKIERGTYRNGVNQELRKKILERDAYICSLCKIQDSQMGRMQVHHIVPISSNGTDDEMNLITVCKHCHSKIHRNGWDKYAESLKKNIKEMELIT